MIEPAASTLPAAPPSAVPAHRRTQPSRPARLAPSLTAFALLAAWPGLAQLIPPGPEIRVDEDAGGYNEIAGKDVDRCAGATDHRIAPLSGEATNDSVRMLSPNPPRPIPSRICDITRASGIGAQNDMWRHSALGVAR